MGRTFLAAFITCMAAIPVRAAEIVAPRDLAQSLFDGHAIRSTDGRGRTANLVFSTTGEVVLTPQSGEARAGSWRLSEEGFCMNLGGRERWSCYLVLRGGDGGLRAVGLADAFTWARADQAAAAEPVSGLAGSQP